MSDHRPEGSGNDLMSAYLKKAEKLLDAAADDLEYAMTNGQVNVQVPGLITADKAISNARKHIAAAKDCIQHATNAL